MESAVDEDIIERFRVCAKRAGGVPALAKLTGINQRTMEGFASGRSIPRIEPLQKICDAVGVNFLWAATGQGPIEGEMVGNIQYSDSVELNEDVLIAVIQGAEEWYDSHNHNLNIPPEGRARVMRALYRLTVKGLNSFDDFDRDQTIEDVKKALSVHLEMIT